MGPVVAVGLSVAAALVTACSGSGTTSAPASSSAPAATTVPRVAPATSPPATPRPGEARGAFVYRTQCAGCHGTAGEGNLGPPLTGVAERITEADQVELVRAGRARMPAFAPGLSEADIAAVVAFTRQELGS